MTTPSDCPHYRHRHEHDDAHGKALLAEGQQQHGQGQVAGVGEAGREHERAAHCPVVPKRQAHEQAGGDDERVGYEQRGHYSDGRRGRYLLLHQRGEDERGSEQVERDLAKRPDRRLPPALERRRKDGHQEHWHYDIDEDVQHGNGPGGPRLFSARYPPKKRLGASTIIAVMASSPTPSSRSLGSTRRLTKQ